MQINFLNLNSTFDTSIYKALKPGDNLNTNVSIKDYVNNENSSSEFKNKVFFTDIVSGQKLSVNLSDKNLNDLQNTFGASQIKQNKDGTYELSGEAENLVAGWFGDIAYQRGYLEADADKNGSLDANELVNTKGSGIAYAAYLNNGKISVQTQAYSYIQDDEQESSTTQDSITQELNNTLSKDKDKDGVLKLNELVNQNVYESHLRQRLESQQKANEIIASKAKDFFKVDIKLEDLLTTDTKETIEELEKQMKEALMKELKLKDSPKNYDLNELKAEVVALQNSSAQDVKTSTASTSAQTDSSLTSLASNIKSDIKANLSIDIYA